MQQWAEANGYNFERITPDGESAAEERPTPADVQAAVENWRDQLLAAISQPDQPPYAPWPEDNVKPYYTDKPDWDAFGAMMLVAACHVYEEPVPPTIEKGWDYTTHPAVDRLAKEQERMWSLFQGAILWIPLSDAIMFRGPLPNNHSVGISTTDALRKELELLNQMAWQADEDTILRWGETAGYPTDGVSGLAGKIDTASIQEHTVYNTQSLAKFAFSLFWQALRFAEDQQVPILLDF